MKHILIFLILVILGYTSFQAYVESRKTGGFTIDLIHRDSKLSPFYNKSATLQDLSTSSSLRSISRANRFSSPNPYVDDKNNIQSSVIPNGGDYLMKIAFGTPAVESYAIADTGSDLVWIQCDCNRCYPQESPTFDSKASSTYQELSCSTSYCQDLPQSGCGLFTNECQYSYGYGGGSQTNGVLSTETITFDSKDGHPVSFPEIVFGCGTDNELQGGHTGREAGLVGLGGGPLSLVSQLGTQIDNKFSYCLLPMASNSVSKLRFGSDSVLSGQGTVSTPFSFEESGTFYYLTLEGISVGDTNIPNSGDSSGSNGNIIIDSGTTLTILEPDFYQGVEDAIRGEIPLDPVQYGGSGLCYDKSSFSGVSRISMVFHFTGADVGLKKSNIFWDVNDSVVCLAIVPGNGRLSIYGNVAQVDFEVQYDLGTKQVSFAPADCTQK